MKIKATIGDRERIMESDSIDSAYIRIRKIRKWLKVKPFTTGFQKIGDL